MAKSNGASIIDCFATLEDPRIERSKRHKLLDIITIAICAIICGADSWVHIEMFGRSKEEWFQTFLELPGGIPSHDTFGEVFSRLDPEQFQSCFMGWTPEVAQLAPGEVVAIDGKTVRRSYDRSRSRQAIHPVSAWASANTMTLGQHHDLGPGQDRGEVQGDHRHSQAAGTPDLHGCIVTIDAMGCQREIAERIVDAGADYVLAVKDNQGRLHDDVRDLFQGAEEFGFEGVPHDHARTLNKGHGRIETRECWAVTDPECLDYPQTWKQWSGLKAVLKITARRETSAGVTVQSRYYISSLDAPAGKLLSAVRNHWSIENSLHWTLDLTFREDQCRVPKYHAPQNLATMRQISHNLLKNETSLKVGIQGQRLQAGWREDYLLKVLPG